MLGGYGVQSSQVLELHLPINCSMSMVESNVIDGQFPALSMRGHAMDAILS